MHRRSQLDSHVAFNEESSASTNLPDIFSNYWSDCSDGESGLEDGSDSSMDDTNDDLLCGDDEEQDSTEYYLTETECLDMSQLRQQRYSPKTQKKLNETWDYWDW